MAKIDIVNPRTGEVIGFEMVESEALGFSKYGYGEFMERVQASGKARQLRQEMRKASNLAYDLEQFFALAQSRGAVDFNDPFMLATFNGLVGAGIITQGQANGVTGA